MVQIEFNKKNENPFYGLKYCLQLVTVEPTFELLGRAYEEVKNDKEKKEMFFSLLFSIGDIANRHHNIFGKNKIDNGGNSERERFFTVVNWLKTYHYEQFRKFMYAHLFNEFTCFDNLLRNRVKTQKGKSRIEKVYTMLADSTYREDLAQYFASIINGNNPFDKMLIAKFLSLPRMSARQGCKNVLPDRLKVMQYKQAFLIYLSSLMGWEYIQRNWGTDFIGYRQWRREYNKDLESVLFSTGKINEFDHDEFINWLNKLPSQARFRVKNKVYYPDSKTGIYKYPNLFKWFKEWETFKETKQAEERVLTEKVRQGTATDEEKAALIQVKKEAKVTTGATNFAQLYNEIRDKKIDKLKLESFVNKVNMPYNALVILDDSGSMIGAPFNFATFLASLCLVKNPDDEARNLVGFFSNNSRLFSYVDRKSTDQPNSLLRKNTSQVINTPLVDPEASFYENYKKFDSFANAVFQGGGTNISAIPGGFKIAVDQNAQVLDALQNYPIWIIISDGEWNNLASPESSLNDFFARCERYFGYRPYIIAIDVTKGNYRANDAKFSGIPNFMYINNNPAQIEQILLNFKDMDVMDVYTPLQAFHRSNRYEVVRRNVL